MLTIDDNLEHVATFAVDIAGMATRYDFTVLRWGAAEGYNCVATKEDSQSHRDWLAVDVELVDVKQADAFVTDCAIAGLYCKRGDDFIHIQQFPFPI